MVKQNGFGQGIISSKKIQKIVQLQSFQYKEKDWDCQTNKYLSKLTCIETQQIKKYTQNIVGSDDLDGRTFQIHIFFQIKTLINLPDKINEQTIE